MGIKVKLIIPKDVNQKALRDALMDGVKDTIKEAQVKFDKTTATWEHAVEWEQDFWDRMAQMGGSTLTDDEIYGYVNEGTKDSAPYPIPKAGPGLLRFQWGGKGSYRAKTRPRVVSSRPGGPTGPIVFARRVMHPGIEARHFDKEIAEQMQPEFVRTMERAVSDARKASGHAI